ncbi:hypothetical protein Egran_04908 [Elaphomyces granulatus]|uniref:Major facilitator superfamily (MFS) profile domain-containing protein n=1 Tax=Elaphomyces granulatus TaxID=519963 RepID=A0A232LT70_9EURO|nr:hypothetical protein Egran_04908 [Elaphomyces granulatus]
MSATGSEASRSIEQPGSHIRGGKASAVVAALTLAILLAALDGTIVATALPSIVEELGSADGYAWVGSSYLLAVTAALPIWGNLSDVWGRKFTILLSNAGRSIQGVGASGLILLVNIIISDIFPIKERAKYMGITNASWALAAAIGPLIGGAFAQKVT